MFIIEKLENITKSTCNLFLPPSDIDFTYICMSVCLYAWIYIYMIQLYTRKSQNKKVKDQVPDLTNFIHLTSHKEHMSQGLSCPFYR